MLELDSMVSQSFAPQLSRLQSEHAPSSLQKFAKAEADSQIISWMKKLLKRANKGGQQGCAGPGVLSSGSGYSRGYSTHVQYS